MNTLRTNSFRFSTSHDKSTAKNGSEKKWTLISYRSNWTENSSLFTDELERKEEGPKRLTNREIIKKKWRGKRSRCSVSTFPFTLIPLKLSRELSPGCARDCENGVQTSKSPCAEVFSFFFLLVHGQFYPR